MDKGLLMLSPEKLFSIIVVNGSTPWSPNVEMIVRHPVETHSTDTLWERLNHDPVDAIIATSCDDTIFEFLTDLHTKLQDRPAIILCINDAPDQRFGCLVDMALPQMEHPLVAFQIQQVIERREDHQQQINALQLEIERLKAAQATQEKALNEVELLKDAIVRNVSHELSTPLLQVKSAVALIAEDVGRSSLVNMATQSTARLEALVKNITQLTVSLDEKVMDPLIVRECVGSAMRELRRTWESQADISRIQLDIAPDLPPAFANRQGITTVFQQLMDNALKFSDENVEVSARIKDERIRVAVRDFGIGIAPDKLEEIFESFYQIDSSETRTYGGTGIGLAIVRLILEHHDVKIHVASVVGKGSTFSFSLPVAKLDKA